MALTEALNTYQTAVADERTFLEAATENDAVTGVDDTSTNDEINDAIDAAVAAAAGTNGVQGELAGYNNDAGFKGYNFVTASDAVRTQIVSEFRTQLEKDVADTKSDVEETTGLLSKANTLVSASAAYETAAAAVVDAQGDLTAEAAKFNELNGGVSVTASNGDSFLPATDGVDADATDYSTYAVTATVDGAASTKIIQVDGAKLVVTAAGEDLEGIDALLATAQAEYQALLTEASAQTRLETSIQSVLAAENPDAVTGEAVTVDIPGSPVTETKYGVTIGGKEYSFTTAVTPEDQGTVGAAIVSALKDGGITASYDTGTITIQGYGTDDVTEITGSSLADASFDANDYYVELNQASILDADGNFDAAVLETGTLKATDSSAYFEAQTDLNDFNKAVQDFQAIAQVQSDSGDLAEATATALEAVEAFDVELNVTGTGTEANDLFVFADAEMTISGFGLQGEDQLYIGEGFSEQRLADDVTDTRLGDSATLEVFFQQEGNNAVIYVENEAFAGNAANAADLTKITLTGVSIDDLQFENGFVSVVEAA